MIAEGIAAPPDSIHIDMRAPETLAILIATGTVYERSTDPVVVREPKDGGEEVVTKFGEDVETSVKAFPGVHKIITGAAGEEYAVPISQLNEQYTLNKAGDKATPFPRKAYIMKNPYRASVSVSTPWGKDGAATTEMGGPDSYFAYMLDENGNFKNLCYLIGSKLLVDAHYHLPEYEENN